jgi:hypothetical protein
VYDAKQCSITLPIRKENAINRDEEGVSIPMKNGIGRAVRCIPDKKSGDAATIPNSKNPTLN